MKRKESKSNAIKRSWVKQKQRRQKNKIVDIPWLIFLIAIKGHWTWNKKQKNWTRDKTLDDSHNDEGDIRKSFSLKLNWTASSEILSIILHRRTWKSLSRH